MSREYSNIKLFHFQEKIEAMKKEEITAPVHIRLKPTNRCNHNCWYCGYQSDDAEITLGEKSNKNDVIPQDKMKEICSDIIDMGVKAVTFSGGGEPLLYPHFVETADTLISAGVKVAVITNGAMLNGSVADVLANRASWVRISMDGYDDDSYRKYRRIKTDEYTKIKANIENFAKIKGSTVLGISYNIDSENYKHLRDFSIEMKDVGVDHIKFSGVVVSNDSKENNKYHEPIFDETVNITNEIKSNLQNDSFSIINLYHEMPDLFEKNYDTCPFLEFLTVIGADLNVYTCQDKAYTDSGKLGSLQKQSFKEMWFSEETKKNIRNLKPSINCGHHCVADSKNRMILEFLNLNRDHLEFV